MSEDVHDPNRHYELANELSIRIVSDKIRDRLHLRQSDPIDPDYLRVQLHIEGFRLPDDDPESYPL